MYQLEIDPEVAGDVGALPVSALALFAEVLSLLEIAPWEDQLRVAVLRIIWLG